MRYFQAISFGVLVASTSLCLYGQPAPHPELKGIPPRAAPSDYQFQTQAGQVTIAAEFTGHSIPTFEGPLTNEDYVAVELAIFGPAGARLVLSAGDFSLRVNGKKVLDSQPFGLLAGSLKDPEYVHPEEAAAGPKSKTSFGGGGAKAGEPPPLPPKIPIPVQRAMTQRVQKAALPEGDRPLPQAGLLFFQHRGKTTNMQSIELLYEGPAGKASLKLQP